MNSSAQEEKIKSTLLKSMKKLFNNQFKEYLDEYTYNNKKIRGANNIPSGFYKSFLVRREQKQNFKIFLDNIKSANISIDEIKLFKVNIYPDTSSSYNACITYFGVRHKLEISLKNITIIGNIVLWDEVIFSQIKEKTDDRNPIEHILSGSWRKFLTDKYSSNNTYNNGEYHPQILIYFRTIAGELNDLPNTTHQNNTVGLFINNEEYFYQKITEVLLHNFSSIISPYDDKYIYDSYHGSKLSRDLGSKNSFRKDQFSINIDDLVRLISINSLRVSNKSKNGINEMVFYFYNEFEPMFDIEICFHGKEIQRLSFVEGDIEIIT